MDKWMQDKLDKIKQKYGNGTIESRGNLHVLRLEKPLPNGNHTVAIQDLRCPSRKDFDNGMELAEIAEQQRWGRNLGVEPVTVGNRHNNHYYHDIYVDPLEFTE